MANSDKTTSEPSLKASVSGVNEGKKKEAGISVLMAVYHAVPAQYLDRSFQSIWSDQELKPDEIILVEDGPLGKELRDVVTKWEDVLGDHLRIVRNEKNIGLAKSLNRAIPQAKGKYLARMDSDDISLPCRFRKEWDFMEANPEIDILGGSLQEFDDTNPCLNIRHYPPTPRAVCKSICKGSPLGHPTVFIRRRVFDSGLRYNEQIGTSEDITLWFDAICAGFKICSIQEIVLHYRRDAGMIKRRSSIKAWNELKSYSKGIRRMDGLFTLKYIFPVARCIFRLMPQSIIRSVYDSRLRRKVLEEK